MSNSTPSPAGSVVVFGGRSEIGVEIAVRLAPGRTVVLAARRAGDLDEPVARVRAAGAVAVHPVEFDADALDTHTAVLDEITAAYGPIDIAVLAFGVLGEQGRAETDAAHAIAIVHTDYLAQVALLTHLAQRLRAQGRGRLVVFSSVAVWRVRRA
ncbi:SDR family NAD(P)-dependent oxidoreductase, partial [Rhodococcus chondri]